MLYRAWNLVAIYYWMRIHKYPALLQMYRRYKRGSKSTGVSIWDSVILYEAVRKGKPRHVLEFGTGASTAFIALALMDNYRENHKNIGLLVSIESEQFYLDHQKKIFPEELKHVVEFVYGRVKEKDFNGRKGFIHANVPRRLYDLIWVDGPALTESIRFSADVVDLLPDCSPTVRVLFDGRDETAEFVYNRVRENYIMRKYPFLHMSEITLNKQK